MKQEKNIVEPGFPAAMYELEKAFKEGWKISQEREPIYIAGLYDIWLEKEERTENNEESGKEVVPYAPPTQTTAQEPVKRGPKPKGK